MFTCKMPDRCPWHAFALDTDKVPDVFDIQKTRQIQTIAAHWQSDCFPSALKAVLLTKVVCIIFCNLFKPFSRDKIFFPLVFVNF